MIGDERIGEIGRTLAAGGTVDQKLPGGGRLHVERLLPYICVYRYRKKSPLFAGLLKAQASYLIAQEATDVAPLLEALAGTAAREHGGFLVLEMWPVAREAEPTFEIHCGEKGASATVAALVEGLGGMREIFPGVSARVAPAEDSFPAERPPLLAVDERQETGNLMVGLSVPVLYENTAAGERYALFYRAFYARFAEIIKRAAYEFIRVQTSNPFQHYLMLGKTQLDGATLRADRKLAKISGRLSFLLATTPVNSAAEWEKFRDANYAVEPSFVYRLIALDPEREKRKLFNIRIDKLSDPTLAYILREKRVEIEKKLLMLEERGTPNFLAIGQSLYGKTEARVVAVAESILKKYPGPVAPRTTARLDCQEFARRAQVEIDYYRTAFPTIPLTLEIRKDVAGIMVSKTKLLINENFAIGEVRGDALIQHEVGTHMLTYCNGKSHPLQQMHAGLSGYDGLQEGIAVLAEYLVGGLTVNRLRKLAGRVVAVEALLAGLSFVEIFDLLRNTHGFKPRIAYNITMRVYRSGGLTKDAVYLAGLVYVLEYLQRGGALETLYLGKFNIDHLGLVEELRHRGILKRPVLPRFLDRSEVRERLQRVREGLNVIDLAG